MKLTVTPSILEAFPDVALGVLVVRGAENRADEAGKQALVRRLEDAQRHAVATLEGTSVSEHPHVACWREAYRAFGAKPKKYPSSIENLLRRSLKGETLRSINPIVDAYNVVSLSHVLPAGGEDLDAVAGDIELTHASSDEPAIRLLGEPEERAPKEGEVIYRDDRGAICRRWNWKEADRTKLTDETTNAVLVLEALPPVTREKLEAALHELAGLVRELTGAEVTQAVADRASPELELT